MILIVPLMLPISYNANCQQQLPLLRHTDEKERKADLEAQFGNSGVA